MLFDGSRRKTPRHRAHFAIRIGSRRRRVQATRRRSGESACHDDDPRRPLATNVSASAFVATLSIPTPRTLAHSPRDTHRESACAQSAFKWLIAIQNLNVQEWPKGLQSQRSPLRRVRGAQRESNRLSSRRVVAQRAHGERHRNPSSCAWLFVQGRECSVRECKPFADGFRPWANRISSQRPIHDSLWRHDRRHRKSSKLRLGAGERISSTPVDRTRSRS